MARGQNNTVIAVSTSLNKVSDVATPASSQAKKFWEGAGSVSRSEFQGISDYHDWVLINGDLQLNRFITAIYFAAVNGLQPEEWDDEEIAGYDPDLVQYVAALPQDQFDKAMRLGKKLIEADSLNDGFITHVSHPAGSFEVDARSNQELKGLEILFDDLEELGLQPCLGTANGVGKQVFDEQANAIS